MLWVKYGALFLIALLIESNLSWFYEIGTHTPDLILILLIYIAIRNGKIKGTSTGFTFGLIKDLIVSVGFLGLTSLTKSITGFIMGYFTKSRRSRLFPGIMFPMSIGIIVNEVIGTMFRIAGTSEGILSAILTKALPSSVYTFVIAFVIFLIFKPTEDLI